MDNCFFSLFQKRLDSKQHNLEDKLVNRRSSIKKAITDDNLLAKASAQLLEEYQSIEELTDDF